MILLLHSDVINYLLPTLMVRIINRRIIMSVNKFLHIKLHFSRQDFRKVTVLSRNPTKGNLTSGTSPFDFLLRLGVLTRNIFMTELFARTA